MASLVATAAGEKVVNWLELNSVTFSYAGKFVFKNANICLKNPGLYICTGPSGVGKTTLALLVSGHLNPGGGEILLDGAPVNGPTRNSILVSQEDDLFPWLKTKDQLSFFSALKGTIKDYEKLIDQLQLRNALELYPYQLSGGMKKRVALLRAVILKPKLLILDETLSSIDTELRESILKDFVKIWKVFNIGVLLITHDPAPGIKKHVAGQIRNDPTKNGIEIFSELELQ